MEETKVQEQAKPESKKKTYKMMELSVSGSFKTQPATDKDRRQFEVKGICEYAPYDYHVQFAERMLPIWLKKDKRYEGINYEGRIKVYVDDYKETTGVPLCIGKDIKEMTWEELMSLACYKKMREIPLYKDGDIRKARETAYLLYEERINGRKILRTAQDVKKFTEKLREAEYSDVEIEKRLEECLVLTPNPHVPEKSYNFAKLPSIIVE